MNVYDFDGTIFPTDCSVGFCIWCMNRHPKLWFTFAPKAIKNVILKKKGKMSEAEMQRKFFGYLTLIDDFDKLFKKEVAREVKARLAETSAVPQIADAMSGKMTKEQFNKLSLAEQQAMYNSDPELVRSLINS
jgi:hypothetical protein